MTVHQRLDRGAQAELVERGGTQLGDDRAQVLDLPLDVADGLAIAAWSALGVALAQRRGKQQPQAAETLQRLVVQLPRPAATFGVGGASELRSRSDCALWAIATAVAALAAKVAAAARRPR